MKHSRNIDNLFIRHATAVAISTVTVLMALVATIFYIQGENSNATESWVMHTYEVTGHIQLLFNRIKDVELGQRGYMIAGDEQYLAPYNDALKDSLGNDAMSTKLEQHHSIAEELAILRKLALDNPIQLQNIDEMNNDIKELLDYWAAMIEMRRDHKSMESKFDFNRGNQLMDNIRRLVGIMMAEENYLLSQRITANELSVERHDILTFSGIAIFYVMMVAAICFYQLWRKQAAATQQQLIEKLAGSNELNNALLSSATALIIATDEKGTVIVFNDAAEKALGYIKEEIVGKETPALWHDEAEIVKRAAELSAEYGVTVEAGFDVFTHKARLEGSESREWTFIRHDDSTFPVNLTATVLRDKNGAITGYMGIIEDISERKRAEKYSDILKTITLSVNNEKTVEDVLSSTLQTVCEMMGWPLGHVYLADDARSKLVPTPWWYIDKTKEESFEDFIRVTSMMEFPIGQGFIGRVYNNKTPIWVEDIALDKDFLRNNLFENKKIHAAFAFPVFVKGNIKCILEFFNDKVIAEDSHFLAMLEVVANQLSRVLERQEAAEEQNKLMALIEESVDYIGMADLEGNLQYHNRSALRMIGLPEGYDVSQMKISDMHPPWAAKLLLEYAVPATYESGSWQGESALLHRDGHEIPVLQNLALHRDAKGEPVCFTTIMRDISERKRSEMALKTSEEAFRSAMDYAPIGMALVSPAGKFLKVNSALCHIIGYTAEELLKIDFQTITHPDDIQTDLSYVHQMLYEKIKTYHIEKRYIHKDGHIIWVLLHVSLVWNEDHTPKHFISQIQDITALKEEAERRRIAEEELRLSEERLHLATSGTSDGLWDWNIVTRENYFSPRFMEELGYAENELPYIIDTLIQLMHPDDLARTREAVEAHFKHVAPYDTEYRLRHKDGRYIWCNARGQAVWDENDKPIRMTGFTTNIDSRKKSQEQQDQLVSKLAESNTELERFAYVASHDMQEPLRMIASFGSLLGAEYSSKLDKEGQEYIHIVTQAAIRMQNMVDDLLEYARIGSDGIRFVNVDATEELKHVLENLSSSIEERKAVVTYDMLPNVKGNPVQFMRLLQNLIGNGLKYQAEGTIPRVHVGVKEQGDSWCFSISDNGIGMPEKYVDQIFQPFKRLHTWDEYKGTGIGLAVCKKIVENHGGSIWVTSKLGEGSIFYFTLLKSKREPTVKQEEL